MMCSRGNADRPSPSCFQPEKAIRYMEIEMKEIKSWLPTVKMSHSFSRDKLMIAEHEAGWHII